MVWYSLGYFNKDKLKLGGKKVQSTFIEQGLNSERYNKCKKSAVGVSEFQSAGVCLSFDVCPSLFLPFSFPGMGKPKFFPHIRSETCWSVRGLTDFVSQFSLDTCGVCHFRSASAKDDGHSWADGNRNSPHPSAPALPQPTENYSLRLEDLEFETVIFCHRNTAKLTILLHPKIVTMEENRRMSHFTFFHFMLNTKQSSARGQILKLQTAVVLLQRSPARRPLPSATGYCRAVTSSGAAAWATPAHLDTSSRFLLFWPAWPTAPGAACYRSAYVSTHTHAHTHSHTHTARWKPVKSTNTCVCLPHV